MGRGEEARRAQERERAREREEDLKDLEAFEGEREETLLGIIKCEEKIEEPLIN